MKNDAAIQAELLRHMHAGQEANLEDLANHLADAGHKLAHGKVVAALKALDKSGAGRFIVGRKGKPSRFLRAEGSGRRAAAATESAAPTAARKGRGPGRPRKDGGAPGVLEQLFTLRPGCMVRIQIPDDLTIEEARRIGKVLEVLAGQG